MSRPLPPNHIFAIVNRPVDYESLRKVFSHPDGLSTARNLVETMLRNDAQRSARGVNSAQSHIAVALSLSPNSNATMPAALREVLSFSVAESHASRGTGPSTGVSGPQSQEAPDRSLVPLSPRPSAVPLVSSIRNQFPTEKAQLSSANQEVRPILQPVPILSSYTQKQSSTSSVMTDYTEIDGFHPINPRPTAIVSTQRSLYPARPLAPYPHAQPHPRLTSAPQSRSSTPKPVRIAPKKRNGDDETTETTEKPPAKKSKGRKPVEKAEKPNKDPKTKVLKKKAEIKDLDDNIWMRILEFAPVSFLPKARLISQRHKALIDNYQSILINQRIENYGDEMPAPLEGMSERQYANLLGSHKGCHDCDDKNASRTHWSWQKRWCQPCWKSKLEREDRILKNRAHQYPRSVLTKMLECIPAGMHDSFMKPHDFVDDIELRPRGAPRLYTYYLLEDVDKIIAMYEALSPVPYVENANDSAEVKAAAAAAYQEKMDKLEEQRDILFAEHKAVNDKRMKWVKEVEAAIRQRRKKNGVPHEKNRTARRELFIRRAKEEIFLLYPGLDEDFLKRSKAFKDATRVYRDPGTERGWQTLKPKVIKEWEERPPEKEDKSRTGTPAPVDHDMQRGNSNRDINSARITTINPSQVQAQAQQTTAQQMMHQTQPRYHNGSALHSHMLQQQQQQQQLRQMQALQLQQHRQQQQFARQTLNAQQSMQGGSSFANSIGQQSYNIPTYHSNSVAFQTPAVNPHTTISQMPSTSYPANPTYGIPSYSNSNSHHGLPQNWHQSNTTFQNPHNSLHQSESSKMAISSLLSDTNNHF